jgi:hypothetical protein
LTADERIVLQPAIAEIFHPYSDVPDEGLEPERVAKCGADNNPAKF